MTRYHVRAWTSWAAVARARDVDEPTDDRAAALARFTELLDAFPIVEVADHHAHRIIAATKNDWPDGRRLAVWYAA